jgi:hypothetical protein
MTLKYKFSKTLPLIFRAYLILLVLIVLILVWLDFESYWVYFFSIAYFLNVLPGIYLHFQYVKENSDSEYRINSNEVIITNKRGQKVYSKDNITKIIVYLGASAYKYSFVRSFAIEEYYFARIYMENGDEIVLTCLLDSNIEKALALLNGVQYERKKRLFCSLSSS